MGFPINPPNAPIANPDGTVTPEWYRFFGEIQSLIGVGNPLDTAALLTNPGYVGVAEALEQREDLIPPRPTLGLSTDLMQPYPRTPPFILDDLGDVVIDAPTDRQVLLFDGATTNKWINDTLVLDDLGDVAVSSPANGHVLIFDDSSSEFVNATLTEGTGIGITNAAGSITIDTTITSLNALSDVTLSGVSNGEVLIASGGTFVNAGLASGANITITPGAGSITIAVSGLGSMAFENTGASGSWTAGSGETITVSNGVVTSIV